MASSQTAKKESEKFKVFESIISETRPRQKSNVAQKDYYFNFLHKIVRTHELGEGGKDRQLSPRKKFNE